MTEGEQASGEHGEGCDVPGSCRRDPRGLRPGRKEQGTGLDDSSGLSRALMRNDDGSCSDAQVGERELTHRGTRFDVDRQWNVKQSQEMTEPVTRSEDRGAPIGEPLSSTWLCSGS
jgi:hypothetical protein